MVQRNELLMALQNAGSEQQRKLAEGLEYLAQINSTKTIGFYYRAGEEWILIAGLGDVPSSLSISASLSTGSIHEFSLPQNTSQKRWFSIGVPPTEVTPDHLLVLGISEQRVLNESNVFLTANLLSASLSLAKGLTDALFNGVIEPILVTKADGRLIGMNASAQEYFKDAGDFSDKPIWDLGASEEDRARLRRLAYSQAETLSAQVRLKRDGQSLVQMTMTPLPDGRKVWHCRDLLGEAQDLTHLARAFRIATLGELSAGIAHEINNPLQIIIGNVELALDLGSMDAVTKGKLEEIHAAAERIHKLARTMTRFADARHAQQQEPLDFNSIVGETVRLIGYSLAREGTLAETELSPKVPPVLGEKGDLEEVVVQLVRNAGEAISESKKGSKIIVRTWFRNGWVRLEVEDDGPGMPPDLKDRIFDPFVTTKAARGGTGLGLSIIQNIVTTLGGRIWVEDAPSGGALFIVELPAWQPMSETEMYGGRE